MDYTSEELKDLKYATVIVKLKDSAHLDTKGYFVGFRPIVDKDFEVAKVADLYVWVYRKGSIHMFHLDYYYMDEISVGYGDKSIISSTRTYKDNPSDQKLAIDRLKAIHREFIASEAGKANGLIDYEKYSDVPKSIKEDIELGSKIDDKKPTTTNYNRSGGANYFGGQKEPYYSGVPKSSQWKKKEVSTLSFKRTTRYNINEALTAMDAKIQEIKGQVYEAPKLKKIPADTKKMTVADLIADEYDDYNYMCG